MSQVSLAKLARDLKPYFLMMLTDAGIVSGDMAPSPHDLFSVHHTGQLADSQATQFLLTNGTRQLTGNLAVVDTITVDGVDISVFKAAFDVHIADPDAHRPWATSITSIIPNASSDGGDDVNVSRGDHIHGITTAAPTTNLSVSSTNAEGSGNDFARATHTHAITSSYQPGAATSLLKTSTGGELFLAGNFSVDTDVLFVSTTPNIVTINAGGSNPTYQGALTVRPDTAAQQGFVLWGQSAQSAALVKILDSSGNDLILLTNVGDLESGSPGFVSGLTGWQITHDGDAEFNNVFVRGELHCSIFVADEMHATGGTLAVLTTAKVAAPKVGTDNILPAVNSTFTLVVQASWDTGLCYFADDDVIRLKFMTEIVAGGSLDLYDVYLEVSGTPTSNSDRDLANGNPGTHDIVCYRRQGGDTNLEIPTGTGMVRWGKVGGTADSYTGGIILTSDLNLSPYMDIFTVNADGTPAPWEAAAIVPRVRLGNLDGVLGLTEQWGLALGTNLSDNTKPYAVFSDQQASLHGITQTWWNSSGSAVAGVDPTAVGAEPLFWLGPSSTSKRLEFTASGIFSLKGGAYITNASSRSVLLNNGLLWCKFDGGPWTSSYWIDLTDLVNMAPPTAYGLSVMGLRSAFNKAVAVGNVATNGIDNPIFYANITDGWAAAVGTGTITRDTTTYWMAPASVKIVAGTTDTYLQSDGTGVSVANNGWVFAQARVWRDGTTANGARLQIRDTTNAATRATATSTYEDGWELLIASWENTTGSAATCQVRLDNAANDSATISYFSCVQLELYRPTPFFHGGMGSAADYSWAGTAHNSASSRDSFGYVKYGCTMPANFTVSFLYTPTTIPSLIQDGYYRRVFEWAYDTSNYVCLMMNPTNGYYSVQWNGNGTSKYISPSLTMTPGVTYHICITYDGTTLTFYHDGTSQGTQTGLTAMSTAPNYFYVGCNSAVIANNIMNGAIDDLIVLSDDVPAETVTLLAAKVTSSTVVNESEIHIYQSGYGRLRLNSHGIFASNSSGKAIFGLILDDTVTSWGNMTLSEGDLLLGSNDVGTFAMLFDKSAGLLEIWDDESTGSCITIDPSLGSSKITIGSDGITLHDNGSYPVITMGAGQPYANKIDMQDLVFRTAYGASSGENYAYIEMPDTSGVFNYLTIHPKTISGGYGITYIRGQVIVQNDTPSPTAGMGGGTINAKGVYDDGTLLTDYVFEPGYELLPISEMATFFRQHKHLPTIPGRDEWERAGQFSLGKIATHLWETVEAQALYIEELHNRLTQLEVSNGSNH